MMWSFGEWDCENGQDVVRAMRIDRMWVIDLEWTCWSSREQRGRQTPDVIEFGGVLVDTQTRETLAEAHYYVHPTSSTISPYCADLTGITPKTYVDNIAYSFPDTCRLLVEQHSTRNYAWTSWGDMDRRQLEIQARREGAVMPMARDYMELGTAVALASQARETTGLHRAMERLGIDRVGERKHSAMDDARDAAEMFKFILSEWTN